MMSLPFARTLALASALACVGATGCTTETKTGTASLTDASSPSTDSDPSGADGGAASGTGHASDAGATDGGSSAANVDAGAPAEDAGVKLGTTSTDDKPERPTLGKSTPFDRILVKPKAVGGDVEALKSLVEKKTGSKLALVRRTAGKWLLLQFAPTAKGRTENDQAKLVDVLKSMDDFASVEGDRLMKVKQP